MYFYGELVFYLLSLAPLFVAGLQDAKTRMFSQYLILVLGLVGFVKNLFYPDIFGLAVAGLILVVIKLKKDFLPKGDAGIMLGLGLVFGVLFLQVLGVSIVFALLYNVVKRREFNYPIPLIPFLFIGAAVVVARLLI